MLKDHAFVDILYPPLSVEDVSAPSYLNPGALAPPSLSSSRLLHLSAPSASLQTSLPLPFQGYRNGLCHSRVILTDLQTFRAFSIDLSGIAAFNTPGLRYLRFAVPSVTTLAIT